MKDLIKKNEFIFSLFLLKETVLKWYQSWEYLSCLYKRKLLLNKKGNLLARIPKLAISLSCLSRFLSGTLGQSRRQEIWASPLPSAKKQSDTAGSSFAKRERGSKNSILKAYQAVTIGEVSFTYHHACNTWQSHVPPIRCSEVLP